MTLRVMIVDDEPLARRRLGLMLRQLPQTMLVAEAASAAEAIARMAAAAPDLILLDIQLPDRSGLELALNLTGPAAPMILFVTAFAQHAVAAWEHQAVGYLLKPVGFDRLAAAIARAEAGLRARDAEERAAELTGIVAQLRNAAAAAMPSRYEDCFWVLRRGASACIRAEAILKVAAERDYVRLHVAGGSHLLRETIGGMERRLDPRRFLRVHRSLIVARATIAGVHAAEHGAVRLVTCDGESCPVGRSYASAVRALRRRQTDEASAPACRSPRDP